MSANTATVMAIRCIVRKVPGILKVEVDPGMIEREVFFFFFESDLRN